MKRKIIHLLSIILIFLLCVLNIQSRYEIRKAREDYFKRGIYYGVKSLRVLIETKEEDITWNKLYVAAIMMEFDARKRKTHCMTP